MHKRILYVVLTMFLVGIPAIAFAACENVNATETVNWSGKLLSALAEDQGCSQASSDEAFAATDACNIFVGRVLLKVYNISDFVVTPARPQQPFYTANEIATLLQAGVDPWSNWSDLGTADNQDVLSQSKQLADSGKLILAVWQNPDANSPGHVALIGPGPLTPSGTWGLNTPVSASFVLNQPQKAFLGQPLSCAFGSEKKSTVHIWVKGSCGLEPTQGGRMRHHIALIIIIVAISISVLRADDTSTISLVGRNNDDSGDSKTFGLMLVLADRTWQEFEPGSDTHFFKSKKGKYIYSGSNTVYLCRENTVGDCAAKPDSQAGQLTMTGGPSNAKKGDSGNGQAEKTGINFNWQVK